MILGIAASNSIAIPTTFDICFGAISAKKTAIPIAIGRAKAIAIKVESSVPIIGIYPPYIVRIGVSLILPLIIDAKSSSDEVAFGTSFLAGAEVATLFSIGTSLSQAFSVINPNPYSSIAGLAE